MSVNSSRSIWEFEADARRRKTEEKLAKRKNPADQVQTALDAIGTLPLLGTPADIANIGISLGRGNLGEAGLSLAAAVPGLGLLSGAGKLAKKTKGIRAGDNVVKEFIPIKGRSTFDPGAAAKDKKLGIYDPERSGYRDIVLARMETPEGKTFIQPFYESTGTSGKFASQSGGAKRRGEYEPFVGRIEKQSGPYNPGWYMKGQVDIESPTKWKSANYKIDTEAKREYLKKLKHQGVEMEEAFEMMARMGDYSDVSKELKRLDELGYFTKNTKVYENLNRNLMNKWLKEQGVDLPGLTKGEFKQGGKVSNKQVFNYLKNV